MSQRIFYRFNSSTEQFERVFPSRGERLRARVRQGITGVAAGILVVVLAYIFIDFPREKTLRTENETLRSEINVLHRRADEALAVMEDLADRDNNFYRVMMQAEPISAGRRYAGLERQRAIGRLDSITDPEMIEEVEAKFDRLERMLYVQSTSFDSLALMAGETDHRLAHIPAIPPISEKYLRTVASGYGTRIDPVYGTTRFHEGLDFSAPPGTPVYATGDGTVTVSGWESAYGNMVEINHGYNYTTRYAHLSQLDVRPGQSVKRGDLIGRVGNTGKSTGPHLHYEVRLKGQPQNPVYYHFYDITPEEYDRMILQAENAGRMMD
ncbi:MAG: M23 family metallopeptidase [Muribaculaceae bacterium]|nr:M23 family metallopeptidase [Muribaculaceae bacterium]